MASMSPLSGKELQNSGTPRGNCPAQGMLWGQAASTHSVSFPDAPPWDPSPQVGAGQVGEEAQWRKAEASTWGPWEAVLWALV